MYIVLNDEEVKALEEIEKITMTEVSKMKWLYSINDIISIMRDLLCEYHHKEEELEDLKNEIEANYTLKHVDEYEDRGISPNDYI